MSSTAVVQVPPQAVGIFDFKPALQGAGFLFKQIARARSSKVRSKWRPPAPQITQLEPFAIGSCPESTKTSIGVIQDPLEEG
jgi:hypothetical protein